MSNITHEEIIEISKHYNLNINQSSTIEKYVLQQQAKEERAKKVEELLGLYRDLIRYEKSNWTDKNFMINTTKEQIKAIEEELK